MADSVLDYMKEKQIPETRQNYLELAFMGQVPPVLDAEEEAALPQHLQKESPEMEEVNPKGYAFQDVANSSYADDKKFE